MGTIPTYPTTSVGEALSSSKVNQIGAAGNFWANPPRCSAWQNTTQAALVTATSTLVSLDSEVTDVFQSGDSPMHDNTTNNSRIVCRTPGKYEVVGQIQYATNATGLRQVDIRLNAAGSSTGGTRISLNNAAAASGSVTSVGTTPLELALVAGDYIEMFGYQSSGGNLSLFTGLAAYTFLRMKLIGP